MQFLVLIYTDDTLMEQLAPGEFDGMMRECFTHTDELRRDGVLLESQMLEDARTARAVRLRNGRLTTTDGPYAEAKEVLGGFNLIEARDLEEAVRIASEFPWTRTGCIEVRPVRDIDAVRERVGAAAGHSTPVPSR